MIINQLRIQSFTSKVRDRCGHLAALLVKSMLGQSKLHGKALQVGTSELLSIQAIVASLPITQEAKSLDIGKISSILDQMASDQMKIVKKTRVSTGLDSEHKYSVNIGSILYYSQLKIIETHIENKFDSKAHLRIFRALQALNIANEKQLEDVCLLPLKKVRSILVELTVEGLVEQHEINATKGIYAYSIKLSSFMPSFRDRIMKVRETHPVQVQPRDQDRTPETPAEGIEDARRQGRGSQVA
jgi:hypothetical protein